MKTSILSLALLSCACAPPFKFQNDSAYPDELFMRAWAETESLIRHDINLDGFVIHVWENPAGFARSCLDVDGLGCTDARVRLDILGAVGTNFVEVGGAVAHMLGHVYYRRAEGDPDATHSHLEWFGPGGIVEVIQQLILEEASHGND